MTAVKKGWNKYQRIKSKKISFVSLDFSYITFEKKNGLNSVNKGYHFIQLGSFLTQTDFR